jgi:hypothetical protein
MHRIACGAIADLIAKLEVVVDLLHFEMRVTIENEHLLTLELGRLRCFEAALVICRPCGSLGHKTGYTGRARLEAGRG